VGYASAGAFLGLAYFDYYYTLIALVVLCRTMVATSAVDRIARPVSATASSSTIGPTATTSG